MLFSPLPGECTAGLDVPLVVFDGCKLKALWDFSHSHAAFNILLVSKDQQSCFSQILEGRYKEIHHIYYSNICIRWGFLMWHNFLYTFHLIRYIQHPFMKWCQRISVNLQHTSHFSPHLPHVQAFYRAPLWWQRSVLCPYCPPPQWQTM